MRRSATMAALIAASAEGSDGRWNGEARWTSSWAVRPSRGKQARPVCTWVPRARSASAMRSTAPAAWSTPASTSRSSISCGLYSPTTSLLRDPARKISCRVAGVIGGSQLSRATAKLDPSRRAREHSSSSRTSK